MKPDKGVVRGFSNLRFQKDTDMSVKENIATVAGAFERMLGLRQGSNQATFR